GEQLRMSSDDMERLHKGFLRHLPVASQDFRDVRLLVAFLEGPSPKLIGELGSEELFEWLCVRIRIDKHKAAPGADPGLGQTPCRGLEVWKIPLAGNVFESSVDAPGEPVEGTAEFGRAEAPLLAQQTSAMEAGVVEGLVLVNCGADHDEGQPRDVIDDIVADVRNVFLAACH